MKRIKKAEDRETVFEPEEEVEEEDKEREPSAEELKDHEEEAKEALEEEVDLSDVPLDTMKLYFADMGQYPLLALEEERELAIQAAAGNAHARGKLIKSNLRLVIYVAKKYRYKHEKSYGDLIGAGNIGLIRAVDKFDVQKKCRLSTYAIWWIRQEILKEIKTHELLKYSQDAYNSLQRIIEKIREIENNEGRTPNAEELSALLNLPIEKVELLLQRNQPSVSLNQTVASEDDDRNYGDFVWDPTTEEEFAKFQQEDQVANVRSFLPDALDIVCQRLSPRERSIVEYHFGVGKATEAHSSQKTADDLKTSIEKVRELEAFVLREVGRMMEEDSESFST